MPAFGDYQNEIYFKGLHGVKPKLPVNFACSSRRPAQRCRETYYLMSQGGCGDERTQGINVAAFQRLGPGPAHDGRLRRQRDLSIELFGLTLPTPLFMAPIGVSGICAQDGHGDLATARAAALTGVPMVASTLSNDPLETVAKDARRRDRLLPALHAERHANSPKASSVAPRRRATRRSS